jgi:hypothetical protein
MFISFVILKSFKQNACVCSPDIRPSVCLPRFSQTVHREKEIVKTNDTRLGEETRG